MPDQGSVRRYPELRDKVALVTGGSSGIGMATAVAFATEGAKVVIASRNERRAQAALRAITRKGAASWITCDTAKGRDVENLCTEIEKRFGQLDFAFNNGGSGSRFAPVAQASEYAWRKTIDGFLTSVFL